MTIFHIKVCTIINIHGIIGLKRMKTAFEWDEEKNKSNIEKHDVDFYYAQKAFLDIDRIILKDITHSAQEDRYFCVGMVDSEIITTRFTYRDCKIRIFGAGYWRKGKKLYEQKNGKIY